MGKNTHFSGQPVYNQLIKLLNRTEIEKISRETPKSEAYVKRLDGYQHLIVMFFGVLKHFDSLQDLEIGMKVEAHKLLHLGLDYMVRRSTLAEANIRRPQEFFAKVYAYLLKKYAKFLADSRPPSPIKAICTNQRIGRSCFICYIRLLSAFLTTFSKESVVIRNQARRKVA